jgi:hypothetical protein
MGAFHDHSGRHAGEGKRFLHDRALALSCASVVVGIATLMITTSPAQAAARRHHDSLSGVSCVGPSHCVAVGTYQLAKTQMALAERWDGDTWSVMITPAPAQNYLSGVSCTGPRNCWAVSNAESETGIEHLQGMTWRIVAAPEPPEGLGGLLNGISCTSPPEACAAVGTEYYPMGESGTFTERWRGPGAWHVSSSPPPSVTEPQSSLAAVSCTSKTNCMAVGDDEYAVLQNGQVVFDVGPIAESWNGSTWEGVTSPSSGTQSSLSGVSCVSPADCWAVGTTNSPGGPALAGTAATGPS